MQKWKTKIVSLLLLISSGLFGQNTEIEKLMEGELKMTFPSIYFKHNSTDYAEMPYPVDSCFKYIAEKIKKLNDYPIWRDSTETNQLTTLRIKKLKTDLKKYTPANKIHFDNMGKMQKISRQTINKSVDKDEIQYLLSLNSVLDVSGSIKANNKRYRNHIERPRLTCWDCWKSGFHFQARRQLRKAAKNKYNKQS